MSCTGCEREGEGAREGGREGIQGDFRCVDWMCRQRGWRWNIFWHISRGGVLVGYVGVYGTLEFVGGAIWVGIYG